MNDIQDEQFSHITEIQQAMVAAYYLGDEPVDRPMGFVTDPFMTPGIQRDLPRYAQKNPE